MTTSYSTAFALTVLQLEGGFVLSTLKHDTGGQTFAGISRNNFPAWEGWALIDAGDRNSEPLKQLVRNFYFQFAWARLSLEQFPPRLAALVFDFAVNSGRTVAVQRLQRLLGVKDDGVVGMKTIIAARSAEPLKVSMRYLGTRLDFLNDLKAWDHFSEGWSQRIVYLINFAAA